MSRLTEDNMADVNFASTQMQGRLEEFDEISKEEENMKKRIESLRKFKNEDTYLNCMPSLKNGNLEGINRDKPITKRKRRPKRDNNRIKSLTSLMEETYSKEKSFEKLKLSNIGRRDVQLSIFQYFSGNKEKIGDILKRIESIEQKKIELPVPETEHDSKILYTKKEWAEIIKNIRLRFPELSSRTKKSLKYITHKIQNQNQLQLILESSKNNNSIWSQASAPPDINFTDEDLRWLYDLSSDQLVTESTILQNDLEESENENPFVMTLSQVMNTTELDDSSKSDLDVILDSSPEPSPIRVSSARISKQNDHIDQLDQISEKKIQVTNSIYDPEFNGTEIFSHQKDFVETMGSVESFPFVLSDGRASIAGDLVEISEDKFPVPKQLQEIHGTQEIPIEILSSSINGDKSSSIIVGNSKMHNEKEEVIVSSPLKESELFKTPTKKSPRSKNIKSSPFQLYCNSSPLLIRSKTITPKQDRVVPEKSSVYSTAKSKFKHSSAQPIPSRYQYEDSNEEAIFSSMPARQSHRKCKMYHTSRLLINGGLHVEELKNENCKAKIRTIETKHLFVDSENEICDSEAEDEYDNSISVIEITREVDDTIDLINLGQTSRNENDNSVLQVPSSPQIDDSNSNVLGLLQTSQNDATFHSERVQRGLPIYSESFEPDENEFNKMSAKELKTKFQEWGLKPVKGKEKMILVLSETNKLVDQSQLDDKQDKPLTKSQHAIKTNIYNNISLYLKQDQYWLDKILSSEPINLNSLQTWLRSGSVGVTLETDILEKYCDELGITYTDAK